MTSKLAHTPTLASRPPPDAAPSRLDYQGTTPKCAPLPGNPETHSRGLDHAIDNLRPDGRRRAGGRHETVTELTEPEWSAGPEWRADLEYIWRTRTAPEVDRLRKRADRYRQLGRSLHAEETCTRAELHASQKWAADRATSMAAERTAKVATCGTRSRKVSCACGERALPVGCDVIALCKACRAKHWRRWRKIMTKCLNIHLEVARREWARSGAKGLRPEIRLLTFTVPHSGDMVADREYLGRGWTAIGKVANAERWWGHYAGAFEVTPGDDGQGHVHFHVAVITTWFPYERLHDVWERATGGARITDIQRPRPISERSRKLYGEAGSAAYYVSKYVTKGVECAGFTGTKAGEMMVAQRGRRKVTTSRHFWRPWEARVIECKDCGLPHRLTGRPGRLTALALHAAARGSWFRMRPEDIQSGFDWSHSGALQVVSLGRLDPSAIDPRNQAPTAPS